MNAALPTFDFAIATHRPEGIERVSSMLLPPTEGVRYVVSWQNHGDAPVPEDIALRDDVEVHRFEERGLSKNRNNALKYCKGDIIVSTDDDLIYYPEGLRQLRIAFQQQSDLDFATFRSDHGNMDKFPSEQVDLKGRLPKKYYAASFEIAFRRSTAGNLRFADEFGLGSPMFHCGDDEIFLLTAMRAGYRCRFLPITVCAHPHASTGYLERFTPEILMGLGATIRLIYPCSAALRIPIKARRVSKNGQASFWSALKWLSAGAWRAPEISDIMRRCNP